MIRLELKGEAKPACDRCAGRIWDVLSSWLSDINADMTVKMDSISSVSFAGGMRGIYLSGSVKWQCSSNCLGNNKYWSWYTADTAIIICDTYSLANQAGRRMNWCLRFRHCSSALYSLLCLSVPSTYWKDYDGEIRRANFHTGASLCPRAC